MSETPKCPECGSSCVQDDYGWWCAKQGCSTIDVKPDDTLPETSTVDLKAAIEDSMARAAEAKSRPGTPRGAVIDKSEYLKEYQALIAQLDLPPDASYADVSGALIAAQAKPADKPGTPRGAVLEEARTLTEGDRNKTHGDVLANHQAIADAWNWWLHHRGLLGNGEGLTVLPSDVAEMMSLLKKARKVSGHAAHHDHGVDDCAYSAIAQELRETGN